jgi:hypothetical protein
MAKTTWGRKETIIWPRHVPIYIYGTICLAIVVLFVGVCVRIDLAAPLLRYYLPVYERASASARSFRHTGAPTGCCL